MNVKIRRLELTDRALEPFLRLAETVYRGDRNYCMPSRDSVLASLKRTTFKGVPQVMLATVGGEPQARLVARISSNLQDEAGRPLGMLGLFEALDHSAAIDGLFREAIGWLTERGVRTVVGPIDGDTWHSYRLNVGPDTEPPFLMEPYNPVYYPEHWERNDFKHLEGYYSLQVSDVAGVIERLDPKYRKALDAGYRLERLQAGRFEDELKRIYALSCKIFESNYLYSPISQAQFVELYMGARALVDPDLVFFARAADGTDAGFLFAFPDRFQAVAAMRGSRGVLARLRFLLARKRADAVNLKSLGVLDTHRRSGLGAALMFCGYRAAHRKGFRKANLCLILDDNPSGRLEGGLGRLLRRYQLYRWTAGDPA